MEKYNNSELTVAQSKCIEMLLEGYKLKDIEDAIGNKRKSIWEWKTKNKCFMAELDRRKQDISEFLTRSANKRFENLQDSAINVMELLLKESQNDNVKFEICKEILNRNIGKISNKLEITATTQIEDNGSVIDDIPDYEEPELIGIE